jgi:hypothetical protein
LTIEERIIFLDAKINDLYDTSECIYIRTTHHFLFIKKSETNEKKKADYQKRYTHMHAQRNSKDSENQSKKKINK